MEPTPPDSTSFQHITINGTDLAYTTTGPDHAPALILIHANISDIRSWSPLVPHLPPSKFRTIAYSRRYAWPNAPIPPDQADHWSIHADDLASLIETLGLASAHLLGNSTGATIALLLAQSRPELVASLLLEEPPLISLFLPTTPPGVLDVLRLMWKHPGAWAPTMYFGATVIAPTTTAFKRGDDEAALRAFSPGVLGGEFDARLSEERRAQMLENVKPHRALFVHGVLPRVLDEDVTGIDASSLVLSGAKTVASQRCINRRLACLLPNSKEVEIGDASHFMHEDQPGEVARVVVEFVNKLL